MEAKLPHGDACIVELDIVGFTSLYKNADEQREVLRVFQGLLNKAGKLIVSYGDLTKRYFFQDTGDGCYLILDDIPPIVALAFVLTLKDELKAHNEAVDGDLTLQLRCVLGYGQVCTVGVQLSGSVLTDAERLISDKDFKVYQKETGDALCLVLTSLFYLKFKQDISPDGEFSRLHSLKWSRCEIRDKHDNTHIGYRLGEDIEKHFINLSEPPKTLGYPAETIDSVEKSLINLLSKQDMKSFYKKFKLAKILEAPLLMADTLINLGIRHGHLDNRKESIAAYDTVIKIFQECHKIGNTMLPYDALGKALFNRDIEFVKLCRGEEALSKYDELIKVYKDEEIIIMLLVNRAILFWRLGKSDLEEEGYSNVITTLTSKAQNSSALIQLARAPLNLGIASMEYGNMKKAQKYFKKVLNLDRKINKNNMLHAWHELNKVEALAGLGKFEEAQRIFDSCIGVTYTWLTDSFLADIEIMANARCSPEEMYGFYIYAKQHLGNKKNIEEKD